jgi:hypothetical protein
VGGVAHEHPSGAIVISAPTEQLVDDIFSDIEDLESVDTAHVAAGDPHTGYQLESGHTKAQHDALNIDADTLDGVDSAGFLAVDDIVVDAAIAGQPSNGLNTWGLAITKLLTIPGTWNTYDVVATYDQGLSSGSSTSVQIKITWDEVDGSLEQSTPNVWSGMNVHLTDIFVGETATGSVLARGWYKVTGPEGMVMNQSSISVMAIRRS